MKINLKILFLFIVFPALLKCQSASEKDSVFYKTGEIIVEGYKAELQISDIPFPVKVFNKEDINNSNGNSLPDFLNNVKGIYIKSYGGTASLKTISINGLGSEHTSILYNGIKINSAQNSQIDLSLIPLDNIEKIEVYYGGSGSVFGSDAVGGTINLFTGKNISKNNFINSTINFSTGSYNYYKFGGNINLNRNKFSLSANLTREKSNNNYEYLYDNGVELLKKTRENSSFQTDNLFINSTFNADKMKLHLISYYTNSLRYFPGMETGNIASSANQEDKNWNTIISMNYNINGKTELKSDFSYSDNLMHYKDIYTNSFYKNITYSFSPEVIYKVDNNMVCSGLEFYYSKLESNEVTDKSKRFLAAGYFSGKFELFKILNFFPSARYENASDIQKSFLFGKAAFNLKPLPYKDVALKFSIGNNSRIPSFNDLYWKNLGNPDLRPEYSINSDIGIFAAFKYLFETNIEVTYTKIILNDKIVWTPVLTSGMWRPVNISSSESDIISLDGKFSKKISEALVISFSLNYTYNSSVKSSEDYPGDPGYRKQLLYVPIELFKSNLGIEFRDVSINLFYNFTGKRFTNTANTGYLPAIDLADANVIYSFNYNIIKLKLKAEINNLFNTDYMVMPGYPMPLRNYKFTLSFLY